MREKRPKARHAGAGPGEAALASILGSARKSWSAIVAAIESRHAPLELEWKASKSAFGWSCRLRHQDRTLLYLTPEKGLVTVAVVLGERAVALALASDLPKPIKALITEARPYAEGRGIRFQVRSAAEIPTVVRLVEIKTAPQERSRRT